MIRRKRRRREAASAGLGLLEQFRCFIFRSKSIALFFYRMENMIDQAKSQVNIIVN